MAAHYRIRTDVGRLAAKLPEHTNRQDALIFALSRCGVIVAFAVAASKR
jgi:predicted phosphoribosyltransferase